MTLKDRKSSAELRDQLGIEPTRETLYRTRLRWSGYMEKTKENSLVKRCMNIYDEGSRGKDRPRKTWWEVKREVFKLKRLCRESAQDHTVWKTATE